MIIIRKITLEIKIITLLMNILLFVVQCVLQVQTLNDNNNYFY